MSFKHEEMDFDSNDETKKTSTGCSTNKYSRVVVKVGTSSLTNSSGRISQNAIDALVAQIAQVRSTGVQVVLVSSGAITAGLERLGFDAKRPDDMPTLQAAASIGQIELAKRYEHTASLYNMVVGQVLLTRRDTGDRQAYLHARDTLNRLLELGTLPLINENDTISVDEIRFGDNDTLAATVASLIGADLVVLLSDIEGLYTADPRIDEDARFLNHVDRFTQDIEQAAGGVGSVTGSGGMATKVKAARVLMKAGIPMVICEGRRKNAFSSIVAGESVGTLFSGEAEGRAVHAKKLWIALGDIAHGAVIIDEGACRALREKGSSLLPVGVKGVLGDFQVGDVINIRDEHDRLVGRGLSCYSSEYARRVAGKTTSELNEDAQFEHLLKKDLVHRDEMIIF